MWYLWAIISGWSAALLALITGAYLKRFNSLFVVLSFSIIAMLILLAMEIVTKKIGCHVITTLTQQEWFFLLMAGLLNGLAMVAYFTALNNGNVCGAVAIDRLGILYVVIISMLLHQAFSWKAICGACMMIIGAILISV